MQTFAESERAAAPSTSTALPALATSVKAAAKPRFGPGNRAEKRRKAKDAKAKEKQAEAQAGTTSAEAKAVAEQNEAKAGIILAEAKAGATATKAKARAMATGTKPRAMGTEVNVAPSKSTSGRDLRLASSSEERPTDRGATSGQGGARASPLAKSQPIERKGQPLRISEILSRQSDAKAQSRSPSSRHFETSSLHRVEQVAPPQRRDRESPEPSSDSSRQVQTRMEQRKVKDK